MKVAGVAAAGQDLDHGIEHFLDQQPDLNLHGVRDAFDFDGADADRADRAVFAGVVAIVVKQ